MTQIVCLANSYKGGRQRCIAGIDMCTREWVRPINPKYHEGAIGSERLIEGSEPQILDILDIPVGGEAEDYGCQSENKILLPGRWKKIGAISPEDALKYVEDDSVILHNHKDRVLPDEFSKKPKCKWKSLQLIHSKRVDFSQNPWGKWCVSFSYGDRQCLKLKIRDPNVIDRLVAGEKIARKCILTISLTAPFAYFKNPKQCWKLVAGVVEL